MDFSWVKGSITKWVRMKPKRGEEPVLEFFLFAPQFILYITFTILPFMIAIPILFTSRTDFLDSAVEFVGFRNFSAIFSPPLVNDYLPAVKRTAFYTFFNYLSVYIFGLPLALIMYEYVSRLKQSFFTIIYLPYIIAPFGIGMMMSMLLSRDTGSLNLLLVELNIISQPIDIMDETVARWALPIVAGWKNAGFNMAIILAGLLSVPRETVEASIVDGVSYFQRLFFIYIPQIIPSFIIATIMCLLGSFGAFDLPVGFGGMRGNNAAMFLAVLLYKMGFAGSVSQSGTLAQAVTISVVTYVPLVLIAILLNRLQKRLE